jgi:hypothetical protein
MEHHADPCKKAKQNDEALRGTALIDMHMAITK